MCAAYPNGITPASTIATNLISELTLTHIYDALGRTFTDPALKVIFRLTSRDEGRHAGDFKVYLARRLEQHPEELASVLETLYVYLSDPEHPIKHPVDIFKGKLEGVGSSEMPDDAFACFLALDDSIKRLNRLQSRIMSVFSTFVSRPLSNLKSVRRELADCTV